MKKACYIVYAIIFTILSLEVVANRESVDLCLAYASALLFFLCYVRAEREFEKLSDYLKECIKSYEEKIRMQEEVIRKLKGGI